VTGVVPIQRNLGGHVDADMGPVSTALYLKIDVGRATKPALRMRRPPMGTAPQPE